MTLLDLTAAERHRRIAGDFTYLVQRVLTGRSPPGGRLDRARRRGHLVTWVPAAQFRHERAGSMPVADAIDRFHTSDIFMHSWDLARSSGQDVALEPESCATPRAGMESMEEAMRSSGQYGPRFRCPRC